MAENVIVASSMAKGNGRCNELESLRSEACDRVIFQGEPIFKVAEEGPTTAYGQGPGRWVCRWCSMQYPTKERHDAGLV